MNNVQMHASLKKRLFSLLIDYLVILGYVLCLLGATLLFYTLFFKEGIPYLNQLQQNLVSFFTLLFPVYLYFIISEIKNKHASIGKRKAGIYLASMSGNLQLWRILLRDFLKLLPWQMAHMAMFDVLANNSEPTTFFYGCITIVYGFPLVNVAFMVFRRDRRALHDIIAGTIVLVE